MTNESLNLQGAKILLIDDQPANLDVLRRLLERQGYMISVAINAQMGLDIATRARPDLILMDVMMPHMDGLEACRRLKAAESTQGIPVIFITAKNQQEDLLAGFDAGGADYVVKPFREKEVLARVQTHVRQTRLVQELTQKHRALEEEMAQRKKLKGQLDVFSEHETARWGLEGFIGESSTIKEIFHKIQLLQENAATSVLISGESGTGKELIARAIHFGSNRRLGPFIPLNCAAIPDQLVESLLFGHIKGAFTGAGDERIGYFELAHEGTLFLDEIGEMPPQLQAKLLRVLEDGQVWPVGAKQSKTVDVRVLAATNADLRSQIQQGHFRADLFFRLARFAVEAPPLRQRQEDIPLLARHFLRLFAQEMGITAPALSATVEKRLYTYAFPGNIRELKNIIERALIESRGAEIQEHHLQFLTPNPTLQAAAPNTSTAFDLPLDLKQAAQQAELWVVKRAVELSDGNVSEAARLLGTNRTRMYRILGQDKDPAWD